jgi:hypothetical protein
MKHLYLVFFFIGISLSAQIKGVVKDSITGKPIPYANIWVENENIGVSTEENGEFVIHTNPNKNLIFTALGFEKKTLKASQTQVVKLASKSYQLDDVVIFKKKETKIIEIGKSKNAIYQAFDNGPRIDVKYFPYLLRYQKTKIIKQVTVETDSKIEAASVKIHFYGVDANGFPGEELLIKDFVVTIPNGVVKNIFNVSEFNLRMPKKGLFVGFEKLIIEKNKLETTLTNFNTNVTTTKKSYSPLVLYNLEERDFLFTFSGGKWNKEIQYDNANLPIKRMVYEPAINLILTN